MRLWGQAATAAVLAAAGLAGFAIALPSARDLLAPTGLPAFLARAGLIGEEARAAEAPGAAPGAAARGSGRPAVAVLAAPAMLHPTTERVTAIGSGRAERSVALSARVAGEVVALPVASGARVAAGDVVAEIDTAAARIARDRAVLLRDDARTNAARVARLRASGAATELQVQEADLALRTAELGLEQAEFDLSQHRVVAPVAGWLGILDIERGDRVGVGDAITRIEDRSRILVDFRVPERVAARLAPGQAVQAEALAAPGEALTGRITAIDNRLDEASRTLRVQAAIDNADDRLRPGQSFAVRLDFTGATHPAVDPLAIQWGGEGAYLWVVREGRAQRVGLRIVQRDADLVLVEAALAPGDLVVVEGVQTLRPGAAVRLTGEEGRGAPAAGPPGSGG